MTVPIPLDAVPRIWRLARLDYDPARQRPVLLYPEGAVLLNDTGREILELVDGQRTVQQIAAALSARYETDVTADVTEYLSRLAERELIQ
jgi:pyrroloquinoline quinone biosynthesis protein D